MKVKTSRELDGKRVAVIFFETGEVRSYAGVFHAVYHYEYHGEYDDAWIAVYKNNIEIQRWNTRHIKGVEWAKEDSDD